MCVYICCGDCAADQDIFKKRRRSYITSCRNYVYYILYTIYIYRERETFKKNAELPLPCLFRVLKLLSLVLSLSLLSYVFVLRCLLYIVVMLIYYICCYFSVYNFLVFLSYGISFIIEVPSTSLRSPARSAKGKGGRAFGTSLADTGLGSEWPRLGD